MAASAWLSDGHPDTRCSVVLVSCLIINLSNLITWIEKFRRTGRPGGGCKVPLDISNCRRVVAARGSHVCHKLEVKILPEI